MPTMTADEKRHVGPEVPERARRRTFTKAYKQKILDELDGCHGAGAIGAVLRREGLYSSHIAKWRSQKALHDLVPQKPGRKPKSGAEKRLSELERALARSEREKRRLEEQLERARLMLELQKKVAEIMALPHLAPPGDESDGSPS